MRTATGWSPPAGRRDGDQQGIPSLLHRLGREGAVDRLLLAGDPAATTEARTAPQPDFVLKGRDVLALGVSPGPAVSRLLAEAEARWLAEGLPNQARQRELLAEAVAADAPDM